MQHFQIHAVSWPYLRLVVRHLRRFPGSQPSYLVGRVQLPLVRPVQECQGSVLECVGEIVGYLGMSHGGKA